jgi:hypothetical protein
VIPAPPPLPPLPRPPAAAATVPRHLPRGPVRARRRLPRPGQRGAVYPASPRPGTSTPSPLTVCARQPHAMKASGFSSQSPSSALPRRRKTAKSQYSGAAVDKASSAFRSAIFLSESRQQQSRRRPRDRRSTIRPADNMSRLGTCCGVPVRDIVFADWRLVPVTPDRGADRATAWAGGGGQQSAFYYDRRLDPEQGRPRRLPSDALLHGGNIGAFVQF